MQKAPAAISENTGPAVANLLAPRYAIPPQPAARFLSPPAAERRGGSGAAPSVQQYSSGSERVYGRAVVPEDIWINF